MIKPEHISDFKENGVTMISGALTDWVDIIRSGIEYNLKNPGTYASENSTSEGRFFDDYCNWTKIPEFEKLIRESPAAKIAAEIMQSKTAQFFHDHVLVKEPGTPKETPWHQDAPYYFIKGSQTVSLWIPVDPVNKSKIQFIAGSHKWEKLVKPVSWADNSDFYRSDDQWIPVPNPEDDPKKHKILEWEMDPGDVVLFDYKTVHGAPGNQATSRRRALSLRWVGDDACYTERPGRTSPPFPGHNMKEGQKLREDWFPTILS